MSLHAQDLQKLCTLAVAAGRKAAFRISETPYDSLSVNRKEGVDSLASEVVSQLDHDAQELILNELEPSVQGFDLGVLAEESEDSKDRFEKPAFWAVDPLDGTLPFLTGNSGYAVSIGLVRRDGLPLIGVVIDPRSGDVYRAIHGQGAFLNEERLSTNGSECRLKVFVDPSTPDNPFFIASLPKLKELAHQRGLEGIEIDPPAGAVMNVCGIARHVHACYFKAPKPQQGGGGIWDYAATACILPEAGGVATDLAGNPLDLNRPDSCFMNHRGTLFASSPGLHAALRQLLMND